MAYIEKMVQDVDLDSNGEISCLSNIPSHVMSALECLELNILRDFFSAFFSGS